MLVGCPWFFSFVALLAGTTLQPSTAPAIDPQADLKIVQDVYGPQIQAVKATPGIEDDLALARQLMAAAEDVASTPGLRLALGKTVSDLVIPIGTDAATGIAQQAIKAMEAVQPLAPIQKASLRRDLAQARLTRGIADHKKLSDVQSLALAAVEAYAELIECLRLDAARVDEIDAAAKSARSLIFRYQIKNLSDSCDAIEAVFKWYSARKQAFQGGEVRLAAAVKSGDEKSIVMAHLALADLCLQHDGDLKSAAKHLINTDDPRKPAVVAAAAFLANPKNAQAAPKIETVEALLGIAQSVQGDAQKRVADAALQICQAYLGQTAAESMPTKPRLLMMQLEKLSGQTADARLAKKLAAGYGSFNAKLQWLEKQQVRCTYDFGTARQVEDFAGDPNLWLARLDVLGIKTVKAAALDNKLRFYANQPFKAQARLQGTQHLGMRIIFTVYGETVGTYPYRFLFCTPSTYYRAGTLVSEISRPRGEPAAVDMRKTFRHRSDNPYQMKITWDGSQLIWSVRLGTNEEINKTLAVPITDPDATFIQVGLETQNSTSYFDDLVIEGKIVEDPQALLVKREPATDESGKKLKQKGRDGEGVSEKKPVEVPPSKIYMKGKAIDGSGEKKPATQPAEGKKLTPEELLKPRPGDENLRPDKGEVEKPTDEPAPKPAPKEDADKPASKE